MTTATRFDAAVFLGGLLERERGPITSDVRTERLVLDDHNLRPGDLPEAWREVYEERAAIREYDGGQAREHAEAEALAEVVARMRQSVPR